MALRRRASVQVATLGIIIAIVASVAFGAAAEARAAVMPSIGAEPDTSDASPPLPPPPPLLRCSVEMEPAMELLAGALAQTDWIKKRGPDGDGSEYYRALKAYLAPYRDHVAVKLLQRLSHRGFDYELPAAFICHLGPLPALDLKCEYSQDLIDAAGSREALEELRTALRDLAAESRFLTFTAHWQAKYDEWVSEASRFDGDKAVVWLEQFFGAKADEYHVVLAPAMFPSGGYAASVTLPSGGVAAYAIMREPGRSILEPEIPTGPQLMSLVLHEWGHSFVNPLLDARPDKVAALRTLYWRTMRSMMRQEYGSTEVFLDEQVLRAITSLAAGDLLGAEALAEEANYHEVHGFYLTRPIIELLREYQAERATYPTLDAFMPRLLDGLAPFRIVIPPLAIAAAAALIIVIGWIEVRRLLRELADRRRRWQKRQPWIWK